MKFKHLEERKMATEIDLKKEISNRGIKQNWIVGKLQIKFPEKNINDVKLTQWLNDPKRKMPKDIKEEIENILWNN